MTRDKRGFTLVELLVVTVLGALVLAAALQVLITNQRTYTAQNAAITGQQSTRIALEVLFNELRLVSPAGGDILMMSADSIRVRMMRKFGRTCDVTGITTGTPEMLVVDYGPVDFAVGDSVFIFADKYQKDDGDDTWVSARVTQVTSGVCPQDASAAVQLRFAGQQAIFVADSVHVGAPVRSFTPVRFALTTYSGDTYLGRGESGGALSPVAGPIRATGGLQFVYRDALGAVTGTPANVRQIVVTVRSGSNVLNSLSQPVTDSITAWVYTRN
jgi:prepilin-type N-terminal cleavage/methylation domain-containing protein